MVLIAQVESQVVIFGSRFRHCRVYLLSLIALSGHQRVFNFLGKTHQILKVIHNKINYTNLHMRFLDITLDFLLFQHYGSNQMHWMNQFLQFQDKNNWLYLNIIISSSFMLFLILIAIQTRYCIYSIDHNIEMIYPYFPRSSLGMLLICISIAFVATSIFLWNKKQNKDLGQIK